MSGIDRKICPKCGEEKDLTEFRKQKGNKNGRSGQCKACYNAYNRERVKAHPASYVVDLTIMKKCTKCGIEKYASDFLTTKRIKTGIASICKKCDQIYKQANYKKRMENPEYRIQLREWHRKHKKYLHDNDPEYRKKERIWDSSPRRVASRLAWRKRRKEERPLLVFAQRTITEHRKHGYEIMFTSAELEKFMIDSGEYCKRCGDKFENGLTKWNWRGRSLHREELYGAMTLDNIRIICCRCNTMQGNMSYVDFILKIKRILALSRA